MSKRSRRKKEWVKGVANEGAKRSSRKNKRMGERSSNRRAKEGLRGNN
jgi:hypothetical protein